MAHVLEDLDPKGHSGKITNDQVKQLKKLIHTLKKTGMLAT